MNNLIFTEDNERIKTFLKKNKDFTMEFSKKEFYWKGSLNISSRDFFFIIGYNHLYPLYPPDLFCFSDSTYKELIQGKFWYGHQYSGGSICLFTSDSGESGWNEEYRLDDVLKVFRIMVDQILSGKISKDHKSVNYNLNDYALEQLIYVNNDYWIELASSSLGSITTFIRINPPIFPIPIPIPIPLPIKPICVIVPESSPYRKLSNKQIAKCYFFPNNLYKELKKSIVDDEKFFNFCKKNSIELDKNKSLEILIFGHKTNSNLPGFVVYLTSQPPDWKLSYDIISRKYGLKEAIFKREEDLKTCHYANLANIKVILIGLGSIGSKIAVELVRNGITNMILYDPEFLEPENLIRGPYASDLLGFPKVIALKHVLDRIAPDIHIIPFQSSPLNPLIKIDFIQKLKESDLIICSLDSERIEYEINALCVENNVPAIFSVALDNAQFGRIFRVIPQKTPCYQCITHYSEIDPDKFPSLPSSNQIENIYSQPGVPGLNLDIWEIALKTTRFAFQTLSQKYKLGEIFKDVDYHHILVGNHQGWIFSHHYAINKLYVPIWKDCPVCGNKNEINNAQ